MEQPRQTTVAHGQQDLDHSDRCRTRRRMPNVGLRAPQSTVMTFVGELLKRTSQGVGLDRVAQPGARSVSLDVADRLGIDVESAIDIGDEGLLCLGTRRGDPIARPILVHAPGPNHAVDQVVVTHRVFQRFENKHADAFRQDHAIGGRIKRLAAARSGEHIDLREPDKDLLTHHGKDTAGDRQRRLPVPQALTRQMEGHTG